jgi:hypothetical protein
VDHANVPDGVQILLSDQPKRRVAATAVVVLVALATMLMAVAAESDERNRAHDRFLREAVALMTDLRAESRRDAERIAASYGEGAAAFVFADFAELTSSAEHGLVQALPLDEDRFNVRPRLTGAHPIGEKDLVHQPVYVAARAGTLGLLLHVGSAVRSSRLDVTSLVRHREYQHALERTNANARADVPTHAMGLAFDISILHVPIAAAREIRDVLRSLRDEGALFFIAETRQLVFHVVLAPGRAPFYEAVFAGLTDVPAPAWALSPLSRPTFTLNPAPRDIPLTKSERRLAWLFAAATGAGSLPYAVVALWLLVRFAKPSRRPPEAACRIDHA